MAFPCNQFGNQEPGDNGSIQKFASNHFGVTFDLYAKIKGICARFEAHRWRRCTVPYWCYVLRKRLIVINKSSQLTVLTRRHSGSFWRKNNRALSVSSNGTLRNFWSIAKGFRSSALGPKMILSRLNQTSSKRCSNSDSSTGLSLSCFDRIYNWNWLSKKLDICRFVSLKICSQTSRQRFSIVFPWISLLQSWTGEDREKITSKVQLRWWSSMLIICVMFIFSLDVALLVA